MDVRVRVRLRVERGKKGVADDVERDLDEASRWTASPRPGRGTFVHEHGHVLADLDHVLLQDQVRLEGDVVVEDTLRLEGHPLGRPGDWLRRRGRVGTAALRAVEVVWKQAHEVLDIFDDRANRERFRRALRRPEHMTPKMQRALLFLVLLSSLWAWLVGVTVLALTAPSLAGPWNLVFTCFASALSTTLLLPTPVEFIVVGAAAVLGAPLAVASAAAGKAVGAWIVFTLGHGLRQAVARVEAGSPATRRFMARAERFARRFGYAALGLLVAIPFSPDVLPITLFSTMGLRLKPFLAAVALGYALRMAAVVFVGDLLGALLGLRG